MGNFYLDIETNGLDPKQSKIITIQYVELQRGTGKQIGQLKILKEWELGEQEIISRFIDDVPIKDNYPFAFIPVGYNLNFENNFLNFKSLHYNLFHIDITKRPQIDLFGLGILMNKGEFKGARLDQFTIKQAPGLQIPKWYEDKDYFLIEDYIVKETKAFVQWYEWLHIELPRLREKLKDEILHEKII